MYWCLFEKTDNKRKEAGVGPKEKGLDCTTQIYNWKAPINGNSYIPMGTCSVTRCWNKKSPIFSKGAQNVPNSHQSCQIFGPLLPENLLPKPFKNSPIWSHWPYVGWSYIRPVYLLLGVEQINLTSSSSRVESFS